MLLRGFKLEKDNLSLGNDVGLMGINRLNNIPKLTGLDLRPKGKGVSHQDHFLGLQPHLLVFSRVTAAAASAVFTAVTVVLEALAVEL